VVKFMGDAVLAAFFGGGSLDHRAAGAAAVLDLARAKSAWLQENADRSLPVMEYTVGVATGSVLAGDVGTSRLRFFDILGEPVKVAQQLSRLATTRNVGHLVAASTFDSIKASVKGVEVEPAEFGSRRFRLYRLEE
jgi:adenylate cyclase